MFLGSSQRSEAQEEFVLAADAFLSSVANLPEEALEGLPVRRALDEVLHAAEANGRELRRRVTVDLMGRAAAAAGVPPVHCL